MIVDPGRQLVTKTCSIRDVFKTSYYEVPANQRVYSWKDENRQRLWDDLLSTIEKSEKKDDNNNDYLQGHFLGAVVIIGGESSNENTRYKIIDGQQRLTTTTILSECLRCYIEDVSDRKIRRTLENYLDDCVVSLRSKDEDIQRIKLNRGDDFYRKCILEKETKEDKILFLQSQMLPENSVRQNIKDTFLFFFEKIDNYIKNGDRDDKIRILTETITNDFYLLLVKTEKEWMAYSLFETLNDRGLTLSKADLIKNVLLDHSKDASKDSSEEVKNNWDELLDAYEELDDSRLDLPQIIQYSYSSRYKKLNKEKIYETISEKLNNNIIEPYQLSHQLKIDSINWKDFYLKNIPDWSEELTKSYHSIIDINWKEHCTPFIMATIEVCEGNIKKIENCIKLCENYLFRQGTIVKDSVLTLQSTFSLAAQTLRHTKSIEETSDIFKRKSPDDKFIELFRTATPKNQKQGFYVLNKIEKHINPSNKIRVNDINESFCLDYIVPKKPSSIWKGIENEPNFQTISLQYGNLTIIPIDMKKHIKSSSFADKLNPSIESSYANTEISLNRQIVDQHLKWSQNHEWSLEAIKARQNQFATEYAPIIWSLNV
ncbi:MULTISPECIES: DUF262 domain-containing protein [unclassified Endozoicomonas]|uniref:DUF262 domain-containing protein n=1 Tax=unclassified Endozoicomonas TaxID=2644528 RepID=UPI003BB5AC00